MGEAKIKKQKLRADFNEELRKFMNNCNKFDNPDSCNQTSSWDVQESGKPLEKFKRLEYLDTHLAGLRSTVETLVSLIMSQTLVSASDAETEKLNTFLADFNKTGQTNYETLIEGMTHALIYGRCGFQFLSVSEGLVMIPSDRYTVIYEENTTNKTYFDIKGYVVTRPNSKSLFYGENVKLIDSDFTFDFEREFGFNENYVYLQPNQFYNMYFYGDAINSDTPLNHDIDRISMFVELIQSLADTMHLSNNEVTVARLKEDIFKMSNMQAGDLVAASQTAKNSRWETIKDELTKFVNTLSKLTLKRTLLVPNTVDKFETLGADISMKEFLSLYDKAGTFIAGLYGLSENAMTMAKLPRDASANPIFEQMMRTSVYPKRRFVELFMNTVIAPKLKISRISFNPESYAFGVKIQNAQALANVYTSLHAAEVPFDKDGANDKINTILN